MRISLREIGRKAGVDDKTVARAVEIAGLNAIGGKYDLDAAIKAIADNADPSLIAGHNAAARGDIQGAGSATSILATAKARAEEARAAKIELELQLRRGELVERAAVLEAGADLIARVRTTLLSIGFRIAPKVEGLDVQAAAKVINDEIRVALGVLGDADAFTAEVLS